MDSKILEIREFKGSGYQPLIDFNCWRVAILRWETDSLPENIRFMERHTQTDEVFVLLHGQATLVLGGNAEAVGRLQPQAMEQGKLYNVRQGVWHATLLGRAASVLIVENRDTGPDNTEYCPLVNELRRQLIPFGIIEQ